MRFESFAEFYPYYLGQHRNPTCRRLHFAGSTLVLALLAGAAAFANPWLLLAGWIHYLAFDLLTGVWEVRDAARRGVPHWLVVPCLALTFMLGPAGWLLYRAVRLTRAAPAAPAA